MYYLSVPTNKAREFLKVLLKSLIQYPSSAIINGNHAICSRPHIRRSESCGRMHLRTRTIVREKRASPGLVPLIKAENIWVQPLYLKWRTDAIVLNSFLCKRKCLTLWRRRFEKSHIASPEGYCLPVIVVCAIVWGLYLTYHDGTFGSKRLRQALADFINKNFSPASSVANEQVFLVNGVTALNSIVSTSIAEEDEALLLGCQYTTKNLKNSALSSPCIRKPWKKDYEVSLDIVLKTANNAYWY